MDIADLIIYGSWIAGAILGYWLITSSTKKKEEPEKEKQ